MPANAIKWSLPKVEAVTEHLTDADYMFVVVGISSVFILGRSRLCDTDTLKDSCFSNLTPLLGVIYSLQTVRTGSLCECLFTLMPANLMREPVYICIFGQYFNIFANISSI